MYLANTTRPDLSLSVGLLSRFRSKPTTAHWSAGLRVLAYLFYTPDLGLEFCGDHDIVGYVDSAFADDKDAWLLFLHHSNESKLPKHVKNNSSLSKVNKNDVNLNYYDDCFEFEWNHVCNTRKIMKKLSLTNRNVKHWSSIDIPSFILYR
jgi:hypothetical protein